MTYKTIHMISLHVSIVIYVLVILQISVCTMASSTNKASRGMMAAATSAHVKMQKKEFTDV